MSPIKLLYLVSALKRCGPINQLYNLIKYLDRERYTASVVTLSPEPVDSRRADFEKMGIPIIGLEFARLESVLRAPVLFSRHIRKEPPAIVHSSGLRADWVVAHCCKQITTITTIRNFPPEDYGYHFGWPGKYAIAPFHIRLLRHIKKPIMVSRLLCQKMAEQYGLHCDFIQNGVDQEMFYPATESQKQHFRKSLNLPEKDNLFIVVGHLDKIKDPLCTAEGFLKAALSNSKLIFIGNGKLYDTLQRRYKSNQIILPGRISHIQPWMQAADFLISASHTEGLPNAVLEAMGCGLPCILSDNPSHREIVDCQPQAGIIFPASDSAALAQAIRSALEKPYDVQRQAALEIIDKHLNAKRMSQKYQSIYEKILSS